MNDFYKKKKMRLHSGFLSFSLFKFPDHHLGHGTYLLRPSWDNSRSAKFRRLIMFISLLSLIRSILEYASAVFADLPIEVSYLLSWERAKKGPFPSFGLVFHLSNCIIHSFWPSGSQSRVLNLWGSKLLIAWKGKLYFFSVTLDV